jgi:hypothetical protein
MDWKSPMLSQHHPTPNAASSLQLQDGITVETPVKSLTGGMMRIKTKVQSACDCFTPPQNPLLT